MATVDNRLRNQDGKIGLCRMATLDGSPDLTGYVANSDFSMATADNRLRNQDGKIGLLIGCMATVD